MTKAVDAAGERHLRRLVEPSRYRGPGATPARARARLHHGVLQRRALDVGNAFDDGVVEHHQAQLR